ncbi:hypothetical protein A2U01_0113379, partial [Trifolium medium]|nr:hypothetical protein [Trifolium medium]
MKQFVIPIGCLNQASFQELLIAEQEFGTPSSNGCPKDSLNRGSLRI